MARDGSTPTTRASNQAGAPGEDPGARAEIEHALEGALEVSGEHDSQLVDLFER
jgi:hypothetical protein